MKSSNLILGGATLATVAASSPHNSQIKNEGELVTESHEKIVHYSHPVEESEVTIDLSKAILLNYISGYSVYDLGDGTLLWTYKKHL